MTDWPDFLTSTGDGPCDWWCQELYFHRDGTTGEVTVTNWEDGTRPTDERLAEFGRMLKAAAERPPEKPWWRDKT